jgi:sugar phosphate isomerase/epimerase
MFVAGTLMSAVPGTELFGVATQHDYRGKLCLFSKHLQWLDWSEAAQLARQLGFDGLDLTVRPGGHVVPERVEEDLPKAVDAIRKAGMSVPMIATGINDPQDPYAEKTIRTAASLGIKYYRLGYYRFSKEGNIAGELDSFRSKIEGIYALNKKYNIHGAYQNHSGRYVGAGLWDLWLLLKDLDPEWIGCQFDIRHAMVEGPQSWIDPFRLIVPYIKTMDIKDYAWPEDKSVTRPVNVPLGTGRVNFDEFFRILREYDLHPDISLHCEYLPGGAAHGHKEITISNQEFSSLVVKDLSYLKKALSL